MQTENWYTVGSPELRQLIQFHSKQVLLITNAAQTDLVLIDEISNICKNRK